METQPGIDMPLIDQTVAAARATWGRDYDNWVEAMNSSLPLELVFIKTVRSMHILATLEALQAQLKGNPKPLYRLWWETFISNIVEESTESRLHLPFRTNAERRQTFEDTPSISTYVLLPLLSDRIPLLIDSTRQSLRELLQGLILKVWDGAGDDDDERWQSVRVRGTGHVCDEIVQPFFEAVRALLGGQAAISVVRRAERLAAEAKQLTATSAHTSSISDAHLREARLEGEREELARGKNSATRKEQAQ